MIPPKPPARAERVSLWRYLRLFRQDILSAQPARLYRARMAEFRTPFFRSFLVNEPELVREVLIGRPGDFPKSDRIGEGLRPLLGRSVFLTNGEAWARQRRLIDPAFEGGRLKESIPAIWAAAEAAAGRMAPGAVDIEAAASHAAADAIFRTLFSIPIGDRVAARVYAAFRAYQRSQPILNLAAFLPLPGWMPRGHRRATKEAAAEIRALIAGLVAERAAAIAEGRAPEDLATRIMTARDPESGESFTPEEMTDQVAIFFLAGHETSASALAWALYLLATHPDWQDRVAREARIFTENPGAARLSALRDTREVFREALRLYPPVPMMVREAKGPELFRGRRVPKGAQVVISPWHLHRHERHWEEPDAFRPERWRDGGSEPPREAYLPFSAGARACPGAGFAMAEGALMLAALTARFRFSTGGRPPPVPVAHLTVRAREPIVLDVDERRRPAGAQARAGVAEVV